MPSPSKREPGHLAQTTRLYGHQDNKKPYHLLDRWEQLNVDMDILAEKKWLTIQQQQRPFFDLPTDNDWSILWHKGRRLIQWNEKQAQHLTHEKTSHPRKNGHGILDEKTPHHRRKPTSLGRSIPSIQLHQPIQEIIDTKMANIMGVHWKETKRMETPNYG
jgi:hypothetical protein